MQRVQGFDPKSGSQELAQLGARKSKQSGSDVAANSIETLEMGHILKKT